MTPISPLTLNFNPKIVLQNFDVILKIKSDPSQLAIGQWHFFQARFGGFQKKSSGFVLVLFYILKHIRLNIGPSRAVRPFVSPSDVGIRNPFLNRPKVLGLFRLEYWPSWPHNGIGNAILIYVEKYWNIAILFWISPRLVVVYSIQSFSIGLWLFIKWHWKLRNPQVVSPSFLNHPKVPGCFYYIIPMVSEPLHSSLILMTLPRMASGFSSRHSRFPISKLDSIVTWSSLGNTWKYDYLGLLLVQGFTVTFFLLINNLWFVCILNIFKFLKMKVLFWEENGNFFL